MEAVSGTCVELVGGGTPLVAGRVTGGGPSSVAFWLEGGSNGITVWMIMLAMLRVVSEL